MHSEHEQTFKIELSTKTANRLKQLFSQKNSTPDVNPVSEYASNLSINSKIKANHMKISSATWMVVEKIWKVYIKII